jgi:hypothetical protein
MRSKIIVTRDPRFARTLLEENGGENEGCRSGLDTNPGFALYSSGNYSKDRHFRRSFRPEYSRLFGVAMLYPTKIEAWVLGKGRLKGKVFP